MNLFEDHANRIVRPIRGNLRRKRGMRDELLGHMLISYERSLAQGLPDAEAVKNALEQLGDPEALRMDLQATVPWTEQCGYITLIKRKPHESDLRFVGRLSVYVLVGALLYMGIVSGVANHRSTLDAATIMMLCLFTVGAACLPFPFLLSDIKVYRYAVQGNLREAFRYSLFLSGIGVLFGVLLVVFMALWLPFLREEILPMLLIGAACFLPLFVPLQLWDAIRKAPDYAIRRAPWY